MTSRTWLAPGRLDPAGRRVFGDMLPYCLPGVTEHRVTAGAMPAVSFTAGDEGGADRVEALLVEAYRRAASAGGTSQRVLLDQWDLPAVARGGTVDVQAIGPGLVVGGPRLARLTRALDDIALDIAARVGAVEYTTPHLVDWTTMERAGYLGNFPQHLTACTVVEHDLDVLDRFATATGRAEREREFGDSVGFVAPAACLHLYARLASTTLTAPVTATVRTGCGRYEAASGRSTTRLWSFTLREVVYLGDRAGALAFRNGMVRELTELAQALELPARLVSANDPFFTADRPEMTEYQSRFDVKHELCARMAGDDRPVAVSSVNFHDRHFGEGFGITTMDGRPAVSACVGFGLERWAQWLAGWLGDDADDWPEPLRARATRGGPGRRGRLTRAGRPTTDSHERGMA